MTKEHPRVLQRIVELVQERDRLRQALLAIRHKVHASPVSALSPTTRRAVRTISERALQGEDFADLMALHADDVERVARHLCRVRGIDPDHVITNPFSGEIVGPQWQQWMKLAESYIDHAEFVSVAVSRVFIL